MVMPSNSSSSPSAKRLASAASLPGISVTCALISPLRTRVLSPLITSETGLPSSATASSTTTVIHNAVYDIVVQYQAEYRGLVQYYQLAYNLHRFNRLKWAMEQSLTKTLAHKLRLSVNAVYERYRA